MNCVTVRDRFAERALGTLPAASARASTGIWSGAPPAARKPARSSAAAAVFALRGRPDRTRPRARGPCRRRDQPGVRTASPHAAPRRGRLAVVAVLAAMFAVAGLGWGAVMAGQGRAFRRGRDGHHAPPAERGRAVLPDPVNGRVRRGGGGLPRHALGLRPKAGWRSCAHPRLAHDHRHGRRDRERRRRRRNANTCRSPCGSVAPTAHRWRPAGSTSSTPPGPGSCAENIDRDLGRVRPRRRCATRTVTP